MPAVYIVVVIPLDDDEEPPTVRDTEYHGPIGEVVPDEPVTVPLDDVFGTT